MNHAVCESCNCSIPGQGAWELRVVSAFYSALVVLRLYNILEKGKFFTAEELQEPKMKSSTSECY